MGTDLYRLRADGKVVGYRKQVGRYEFFSRDDFWYNGTAFEFESEEAFTGAKDRRGRKLFVGDVVRGSWEGVERTVRIIAVEEGSPRLCCHRTELPLGVSEPMALLAESLYAGQV